MYLQKGHGPPLTKHYGHLSSNLPLKPCTSSSSALCFQARFFPNNRYFQSKEITPNSTEDHIISHHITTAEMNLYPETKAEWALTCLHLVSTLFLVQSEPWSLLFPLLPALTSVAWSGGCISSHQLYNLETWGLFQSNHRNLRLFQADKKPEKQVKHSGESLVSFNPWPLWRTGGEEAMG